MPEGENFFHQVNIASQRGIFEQTYFPFFSFDFFSLLKKLISIILLRRRIATKPKKMQKNSAWKDSILVLKWRGENQMQEAFLPRQISALILWTLNYTKQNGSSSFTVAEL